ncbi:MAG: sulfurtransferase TusA family protein [Candidatus Omnitrophica bacterium]|nr:sulfurtransferase TusA family protein [Candidatus Omnitrophota bacterium]
MKADFVLDCSGHLCPVPILMTEEKMADLKKGDVLEVIFTDPGARSDLEAWCQGTGHALLGFRNDKFKGFASIRKN